MNWFLALPFVVGSAIVLQHAFNRQMTRDFGLPQIVLLSTLVFAVLAGFFFVYARVRPEDLPESLRARGSFRSLAWWHLFPGLCGFVIVVGAPWAITRLGALKVIVTMIAAQLLVSLAWDSGVEGMPVTWMRVAGVLVTLIGAYMAVR